MEQQLDELLSKVQVNSTTSARSSAQENFDKIDAAGERLDHRGHPEGRHELHHHARMTRRPRQADRVRGRRGRRQDDADSAARRDARRARHSDRRAVREPGGTPVGETRSAALLLDPGPRAVAARRGAAVHGVAGAARASGSFGRRSAGARRGRWIGSSCRPTPTRSPGAGLPEREVARREPICDGRARARSYDPAATVRSRRRSREPTVAAARDRIEPPDDDFHQRVAAAFERFADPAWQREHPESGPVVADRRERAPSTRSRRR